MKPVLIDLFCGAGGAAMGYHRAGFEVLGVDIKPQHNYPFKHIQVDWREPLLYLPGLLERDGVKYAIHASPPCQGYSPSVTSRHSKWSSTRGKGEPRLIPEIRKRLLEIEVPFVIENVVGAKSEMREPTLLCGSMFMGLGTQRHRLFETNWNLVPPPHPYCRQLKKLYAEHRGWDVEWMRVTGQGGRTGTKEIWKEIMGIDWDITIRELAEAIPPAYTEHIGKQLMELMI